MVEFDDNVCKGDYVDGMIITRISCDGIVSYGNADERCTFCDVRGFACPQHGGTIHVDRLDYVDTNTAKAHFTIITDDHRHNPAPFCSKCGGTCLMEVE